MESRVVCTGCMGRKEVSPLGGIPRKCAVCEGLGYLFVPAVMGEFTNSVKEELKDKYQLAKTLRRRGRRPRGSDQAK